MHKILLLSLIGFFSPALLAAEFNDPWLSNSRIAWKNRSDVTKGGMFSVNLRYSVACHYISPGTQEVILAQLARLQTQYPHAEALADWREQILSSHSGPCSSTSSYYARLRMRSDSL